MNKKLAIGLTALILDGCSIFFRTPEAKTTPIEPPKPQSTASYSPTGEISPVGRAKLHKWSYFIEDKPTTVEYFCPTNITPWNVTARVEVFASGTPFYHDDVSPLEAYVCKGTVKYDRFVPRSCEGNVPTEIVNFMKNYPVRD